MIKAAPIRRLFQTGTFDAMPITLLDIIVLGVMLLSGLLAMVRGFMREILSIAAWATAAIVTLTMYQRFVPMAKEYTDSDTIATVAVAAILFLGTLIVASVITVKVSDMILDSRIGALDRTLGFMFGLARGLLIVVVAFAFFDWLAPKSQPNWVTSAKSLGVLKGTGEWLQRQLPEDVMSTISRRLGRDKRGTEDPEAPPPQQRTETPAGGLTTGSIDGGYTKAARDGLRQLLEGGKTPPAKTTPAK
jgi:membrane protein required for colicin V production